MKFEPRSFRRYGAGILAGCVSALLIMAPSAVAAPFFWSEVAPVTYGATLEGESKFETNAGTVQCTSVSREATAASTSVEELEFTTSYSGCKAFGFIAATVSMNGCKWRDRLVSGSSPPTATTSLVCPAGQELTMTTPLCIVHFPGQTNKPHIVYQNQGSGTQRDWTETQTLSGLSYTVTSGCANPGSASNGAMIDAFTVKGFKGNGQQQGIWVQ